MKKVLFVFCFLFSTKLCLAHKDSTQSVTPKVRVLSESIAQKDTLNDGWENDSWSPEPRPLSQEEKREIKKAERQKKREQRQVEKQENPSNFPRGVGWSSVAIALIGLAKIWLSTCK